MNKNIGVLLLVIGLAIGAYGVYEQSEKSKILEIGNFEIKAGEKGMNDKMILGGVIAIIGGAIMISNGKKRTRRRSRKRRR